MWRSLFLSMKEVICATVRKRTVNTRCVGYRSCPSPWGRRREGPWTKPGLLIAPVVGSIIGSGIFGLPPRSMADATDAGIHDNVTPWQTNSPRGHAAFATSPSPNRRPGPNGRCGVVRHHGRIDPVSISFPPARCCWQRSVSEVLGRRLVLLTYLNTSAHFSVQHELM